jgi:tetratricopeptide (TPR) repeat protein
MTKSLWPSAFVTALFAIHPLHVESVAWITERKDVLSAFFWMLTLGAYSYYVEHPGFLRYIFILLFFAMGLMAKSMLVTLPFVLLLLDYWPLRRFQEINPEQKIQAEVFNLTPSVKETLEVEKPADTEYKWSLIYPLLLEKVPLFVLAVLSSIVTYLAAQSAGAVRFLKTLPLGARIENAFVSYIAYIGKMIWPSNLAVFYPHQLLLSWQVLGSVLLLITITVAVFMMVKRSPYLATGWLWYLGTLVPVIGILQAGSQAMADRYTYIPLIGLFIIVAWGVPDLLKKWNYRKEILWASSALVILCLSIITWTQVGYWQNSITLYDHTLKITDYNWPIYYCRGNAYSELGNYRQAIEDLNRAIEIKPDYVMAYTSRGVAYIYLGNYRQAIEDFNRVIAIRPNYPEAYLNRGLAYGGLGNYRQAIEDFNRVIAIRPNYPEAYLNRGFAYNGLGNYRQAIEDFNRVIAIRPSYAEAYNNRGLVYGGLGNYRQAIEDYGRAIKIKPDYADAYYSRGNIYSMLGQYQLAIEDFNKVISLKPDYADAYYNRGTIYYNLGQKQLAIGDFNKVIHLKPDYANAYYQRGVAYKNMEQNQPAIENFTTAIRLQPANVLAYFNRGTVYNILNQDKQAIDDYNEAIRLNPGYVDAYNSRGITYNKLGEYQLAIKDFTESIKLQPNNPIAYNNRGIAHFKQGDNDLCCSDVQKACSMGFCKGFELFKSRGYCH